jgi:hypothetical protein
MKIQCLDCGQIINFASSPGYADKVWWVGMCHGCGGNRIWENVDEIIDNKDYLSLYAVRKKFVKL